MISFHSTQRANQAPEPTPATGRGSSLTLGKESMSKSPIKQLFEREPDNAPGDFYVVKDICITCALPAETAPASVSWNRCPKEKEDGSLHCRVHRQPETEAEIHAMIAAAAGSCVEAIRYCGTDEKILAAFRRAGMERLCDALHRL